MIHNSEYNPLSCLHCSKGICNSMVLGAALENIKLRLISNCRKHTSIYEISIELVERCTNIGH
jgi:hypothetical protein